MPFLGQVAHAQHFLLQQLQGDGDVVDGLLHLFVIALVGVSDQLVDLAVRNLGKNAVAFADGQQDRIKDFVDALNNLALRAIEHGCLAALGETAFLGRVHQAHDLVQNQLRIVFNDPFGGAGTILNPVSIAGAMCLPAFTNHCCCRHETRSSLG